MKKTDIPTTVNTERLSNRDYQKALRRAKRAKRVAAKAKAKATRESKPKVYDMFVLFDKRNQNVVMATLDQEKIKPVMTSEVYAWIRNASEETKNKVCEAMSRCTVKYNGKDYKVRVSAMKSKEEILKEKKVKSPSNNTAEARLAARRKRRAANIESHKHHHDLAVHRKLRKQNHIVGRKAKLYVRDENGNIVRKSHVRGSQWSNLREKKLLERAQKAGKYLLKKEDAEAKMKITQATKKPSKKASKPVQTELPLAA